MCSLHTHTAETAEIRQVNSGLCPPLLSVLKVFHAPGEVWPLFAGGGQQPSRCWQDWADWDVRRMGSEYQMQQFINKPATARLLFAHESYKYSELTWHQSSTATSPGPHTLLVGSTRPLKEAVYKATGMPLPPSAAVNRLSLSPTLRRTC